MIITRCKNIPGSIKPISIASYRENINDLNKPCPEGENELV